MKTKTVKIKSNKVKNNLIRPTLVIGILGCMVVLLRLELGQYLEAGSNLTENDMFAGILENSTQSKSGGKEHSGQNQHQFLQNYKYRRKKVLSSRLNRTFGNSKIRIQNETKTKHSARNLPTCGAVVSDTGYYGLDLLYKQDKFDFSLITAVRFQEQNDDSEEKKRDRPESDLETDKTQSFQTKPDEAGTALSISKLNSATSKSKAETEKTTKLVEQMDINHPDIPNTVDIVQAP